MYDPVLGNDFRNAKIVNYAPTLAFKTPYVNMSGGNAHTSGPANTDTEAITGTVFKAP